MSEELKPCACGDVPTEITVYGVDQEKWMWAVPNCCGEWSIEFRSGYGNVDDPAVKLKARAAWTQAPREKRAQQEVGDEQIATSDIAWLCSIADPQSQKDDKRLARIKAVLHSDEDRQ